MYRCTLGRCTDAYADLKTVKYDKLLKSSADRRIDFL